MRGIKKTKSWKINIEKVADRRSYILYGYVRFANCGEGRDSFVNIGAVWFIKLQIRHNLLITPYVFLGYSIVIALC